MTPKQIAWRITAAGSAALAALGMRQLLKLAWRRSMRSEPTEDPTAPGQSWTRALLWAMLAGAGAAFARVGARRVATLAWQRATGDSPPGYEGASTS
jgi:Protein of unknown function (DUF4235)